MVLLLDAERSQRRDSEHDARLEDLWRQFSNRYELPPLKSEKVSTSLLNRLCRAFSEAVPFENVTKFLQRDRIGAIPRLPEQLLSDHLQDGTGGTCYALCYALRDLLTRHGFSTELCFGHVGPRPVSYFKPNHAAVLVALDAQRYIVDPGMMFRVPVRLPEPGEGRVDIAAREASLRLSRPKVVAGGPDMVHLELNGAEGFRHGLSLELSTTGDAYFMRTWKQSFDPIAPHEALFLNRFVRSKLWTLENRVFQVRGPEGVESSRWVGAVEAAYLFGLPRAQVEAAFALTPNARKRARIRQHIQFRLGELQRGRGRS